MDYELMVCTLEMENSFLQREAHIAQETLAECRAAIPDTPAFDFLAGKTLPECIKAMALSIEEHYRAKRLFARLKGRKVSIEEKRAALPPAMDERGS